MRRYCTYNHTALPLVSNIRELVWVHSFIRDVLGVCLPLIVLEVYKTLASCMCVECKWVWAICVAVISLRFN